MGINSNSMLVMKTGLFHLIFFAFFVSIKASASFYSAPVTESKWTVSVSRAECTLSHAVPSFGVATFSKPAGKPLSFQLQPKRKMSSMTRASLAVSAPAWIHETAPSQHYAVYKGKSGRLGGVGRLIVRDEVAEMMLNELNAGWFPTFIYTTESVAKMVAENQIAVSAVNFRAAFEVFDECRENILPVSFDEIRSSHLFFAPLSSKVDHVERDEVELVAEYLALMPERSVSITPYSGWGGKSAKKRFGQRVAALKSILVKKGVKSEQIKSIFKRSQVAEDSQVASLKLVDSTDLTLLHYRPKSVVINSREKRQLSLLAEYFKEKRKGSRVVVHGHTDSKGDRKSNKKIAAKRAEVVRQYLISKGIPADRIRIKAWGERKPVSSNRSSRGQANNRRVQVSFVG